MNIRLKLFPAFVTLLAGAVTGIITYWLRYDKRAAYLILLCVLLFFYIVSSVLQKLIWSFEKENDKKREADLEGKVVEKDAAGQQTAEEEADKKQQTEAAGESQNS